MRRIGFGLLVVSAVVVVVALVTNEGRVSVRPDLVDEGPSPRASYGDGSASASASGRGSVYGTVRRGGHPVVGRVEARLLSHAARDADSLSWPFGTGPALGVVETDEAGRFEIPGLPVGLIGLEAIAADGAVGRATAWIPGPGLRTLADVRIPSGPHSFRGRAVWSDGRPFRGLVGLGEVLATEQPFDPDAVSTGEDGRFTITGLGPGVLRLSALSEDLSFRTLGRRILIPLDSEYEFVVDRGFFEWSGRVTAIDDGSPVEGAKLEITGASEMFGDASFTWTRAKTDAAGRFRFRAPRRVARVAVRAEGYLNLGEQPFEQGAEIEIRLDRTASVTGLLVSAEDGRPLSGVPIHHGFGEIGAVTDEAGRFRIEVAGVGHQVVYARGDGWVSPELARSWRRRDGRGFRSSPLLRMLTPGETTEVELTAVRAARVEGRVVDADGNPVAGETVHANATNGADGIAMQTDAKGRFTCDQLIPGVNYLFTIEAHWVTQGRAGPCTGAPGETLEVEIRLQRAQHADVVVRDANTGAPIAEARVDMNGLWGHRLTDASGRVRLDLLGLWPLKLWVEHPDYQRVDVEVEEENADDEIALDMEPGLTLSGTVTLPDGSPAETGRAYFKSGDRTIASDELGFGGAFCLRGLPPGEYVVGAGVTHEGRFYRVETATTVPAEDVHLALAAEGEGEPLEPGKRFTVRVLGPDGRIVPSVRIGLMCWEDADEGDPDEQGSMYPEGGLTEFEIHDWYDFVQVTVFDARSAAGLPLPLGPALLNPVPVARGEVEVRLPPERAMTGRVVDQAGRGVPGVEVSAFARGLEQRGLYESDIPVRSTFTHPDGTFRIGGLGDFEIIIEADAPRGFLPSERMICRAGDTGVELVLRRGASATVRVLDASGAPLAGARVVANERRTGYVKAKAVTNQHGSARLEGLDPEARFTLRANPPEGRDDLHACSIEDWIPADTEVRIPVGWLVRGVVVDTIGRPVPEAVVRGRAPDDRVIEVTTGKAGEFEIGPFPAEGAELGARPPGNCEEFWRGRWERVEAGASDVKLALPPYGDLDVRLTGGHGRVFTRGILTNDEGKAISTSEYIDDGRILYRGLPADRTYTIFVEPDYFGRMTYVRGLRPGPAPVEVGREEGGTIRGTVEFPPDATGAFLSIRGRDFEFISSVNEDGSFVILGLPPGPCSVRAFLNGPGNRVTKWQKAEAGDVLRFGLE